MKPLCLLQVCNVGRIVGGTAACAWTVTRALAGYRHVVVFRKAFDEETRRAFCRATIANAGTNLSADIAKYQPDLVLLHNTGENYAQRIPRIPTIQYRHSVARVGRGHTELCCSHWLANQLARPGRNVLWQGVPRPIGGRVDSATTSELIVGRICTPARGKWPAGVVEEYRRLRAKFPGIRWEFVGCPGEIQGALLKACGGAATFWPASWDARRLLCRWQVLYYRNATLTESFGRTVAEGMRAGCIPVVDRRGGFMEQVADGTGYLCDDARDVVRALSELHDQKHRMEMSQRARMHSDRHFSLAVFARQLLLRFDEADRVGAAAGEAFV